MYYLETRFDKCVETPQQSFYGWGLKVKATYNDRVIKFDTKPSLQELQSIVATHNKKYNGLIKGYGEIKYYEFYKKDKIYYKFDTLGNFIENNHFLRLIEKFYFNKNSDSGKKIIIMELQFLQLYEDKFIKAYKKLYKIIQQIVNRTDPFDIAFVAEDEYEFEIKNIALVLLQKKNVNKKKVFKIVQNVFDEWFYRVKENDEKYWQIATVIIDYLQENNWCKEWQRRNSNPSSLYRWNRTII